MLVIKKELDFNEFENLFSWELEHVSWKGQKMIYDYLIDAFYDGAPDEMTISDYLRYQIQVLSVDEFVSDYIHIIDELDSEYLEDLESSETVEAISNLISDYTNLIGTYEEDGETYFIFEEF